MIGGAGFACDASLLSDLFFCSGWTRDSDLQRSQLIFLFNHISKVSESEDKDTYQFISSFV